MVVLMEKYCKSCGAIFNDLKFKICPYCGRELDTRYGRQPIPRKLRHEVFKRDGYRCRECGASKDETSLEIDHIVPVARGGTNDIDNLQTLCRECNRMKHTDEWVGGETDLEVVRNELMLLNNQINEAEQGIIQSTTENEKIDFQFRAMKLKEKIKPVTNKYNLLLNEEKERKIKQEEKEKKDNLFKRLYVTLDDNQIKNLRNYCFKFNLNKDDIIKDLINKYSEEEIQEILDEIKEFDSIKFSLSKIYDEYIYEYQVNGNQRNFIKDNNIYELKKKVKLKKLPWKKEW